MNKRTRITSKFYLPGMPITFVKPEPEDEYAGRIWYIHKSLPNGEIELITEEMDITMRVKADDIKFDGPFDKFCITLVEAGFPYQIDLKNRTLVIDKVPMIVDGKPLFPLNKKENSLQAIIDKVQELYSRYKRSVPSKRDADNPSRYFRALKEEDLSTEDMLFGEARNIAEFKLEFYILQEVLKGTLRWDKNFFGEKSWFWQSPKDKDLVLMKEWIER